jgi:hypothetical protein
VKKSKSSTVPTTTTTTVANLPKRSATWFFNKASSLSSQNLSKSLNKLNKSGRVEEREWLLLGEPSSPLARPQNEDEEHAESSIGILTVITDTVFTGDHRPFSSPVIIDFFR